MAMTVCKRVIYRGRVQGVGFRYTTRDVADDFAVAGYVKNLPDDTVEVVVEGDAAEVERFLAAVAERMAGYIQGHTIHEDTPRGFAEFVIRT
jgi:acylphosphatase